MLSSLGHLSVPGFQGCDLPILWYPENERANEIWYHRIPIRPASVIRQLTSWLWVETLCPHFFALLLKSIKRPDFHTTFNHTGPDLYGYLPTIYMDTTWFIFIWILTQHFSRHSQTLWSLFLAPWRIYGVTRVLIISNFKAKIWLPTMMILGTISGETTWWSWWGGQRPHEFVDDSSIGS